jgi:hypothetical protein
MRLLVVHGNSSTFADLVSMSTCRSDAAQSMQPCDHISGCGMRAPAGADMRPVLPPWAAESISLDAAWPACLRSGCCSGASRRCSCCSVAAVRVSSPTPSLLSSPSSLMPPLSDVNCCGSGLGAAAGALPASPFASLVPSPAGMAASGAAPSQESRCRFEGGSLMPSSMLDQPRRRRAQSRDAQLRYRAAGSGCRSYSSCISELD